MLELHGEEKRQETQATRKVVCHLLLEVPKALKLQHFPDWSHKCYSVQLSPLLCCLPRSNLIDQLEQEKSTAFPWHLLSHDMSQVPLILSHKYFCLLFLNSPDLDLSNGSLHFHCHSLCSVLPIAVKRVRRLMCLVAMHSTAFGIIAPWPVRSCVLCPWTRRLFVSFLAHIFALGTMGWLYLSSSSVSSPSTFRIIACLLILFGSLFFPILCVYFILSFSNLLKYIMLEKLLLA